MNRILLNKLFALFFVAISVAWSSVALAGPLGFVDLGNSTIDTKTGLEWLDVTQTAGRSFSDVSQELASDSGLGADGWRYATVSEFATLSNNYFGTSIDSSGSLFLCLAFEDGGQFVWEESNCGSVVAAEPITTTPFQAFLNLFGATGSFSAQGFLDFQVGNTLPGTLVVELYSAYIAVGDGIQYMGEISATYGAVFDCSGNFGTLNAEECVELAATDSLSSFGSYLVRTALVPEPAVFSLLLLGLLGLSVRRLKSDIKDVRAL